VNDTVTQRIERARAYLAATVALTPDTPAAELLTAAAECRAHLAGTLGIIDDQYLAYPAPDGEQARLRDELLAEVPDSQRAEGSPDIDYARAVATSLARMPGDNVVAVTRWLRAARQEAPVAVAGDALTALATWIDEQLADETAGRQEIAQEASGRVKDVALQLLGTIELARQGQSRTQVPAPLETERQALDLPEVRNIYDTMHATNRRGVGDELCLRLLEEACAAAGVELGAYDRRILAWLAGWEAQMCAVIAGLIARAAAGKAAGQ
jgi:hypothetical protein